MKNTLCHENRKNCVFHCKNSVFHIKQRKRVVQLKIGLFSEKQGFSAAGFLSEKQGFSAKNRGSQHLPVVIYIYAQN